MEPHDNADYGKLSYWNTRYIEEDSYDWFATVYQDCVEAVFASVENVFEKQTSARNAAAGSETMETVSVLHLGVGNSAICEDLYALYARKYHTGDLSRAPYRLVQVGVDYSEVVIEKMKGKYSSNPGTSAVQRLPDVHWEVADVRDLARIRALYGPCFDVVVDKATMDALQADKEKEQAEDDIAAMLMEVSKCLVEEGAQAPQRYRQFLQMTWEVPYYRLYHTTRNEEHTFAWGESVQYRFLGESDMYRLYTYDVVPAPSAQ